MPKEVTHEITPEGNIGALIESDPKNLNGTMVRFIETGVTMNFQTAAMVHAWLGEQLGQMQAIMRAQAEFMEQSPEGQE